jgi:hypothetical protein
MNKFQDFGNQNGSSKCPNLALPFLFCAEFGRQRSKLISQNEVVDLFSKVNSPRRLSTDCLLLLI